MDLLPVVVFEDVKSANAQTYSKLLPVWRAPTDLRRQLCILSVACSFQSSPVLSELWESWGCKRVQECPRKSVRINSEGASKGAAPHQQEAATRSDSDFVLQTT